MKFKTYFSGIGTENFQRLLSIFISIGLISGSFHPVNARLTELGLDNERFFNNLGIMSEADLPPQDCTSSDIKVQNPENGPNSVEARFCENGSTGIGDLYIHNNSSVAHVQTIISDDGDVNILLANTMTWGPDYWHKVGTNISIPPGNQLIIYSKRFGSNTSLTITATLIHIELIANILFLGTTPDPNVTHTEEGFKYLVSAANHLLLLVPGAPELEIQALQDAKECSEAFEKSNIINTVSCLINIGNNEYSRSIIRIGLLKLGVDLADPLIKLLFTIGWEGLKGVGNIGIYLNELSNPKQDGIIYIMNTKESLPPTCLSCDQDATLLIHLTLPDGTLISPNQILTKTWRLKNTGTTTWGNGYKLVFVSGEQMGAPAETDVPTTAPNQTVDLSVSITAPTSDGEHTGYFQLRNPQGTYFGPQIWVKINVRASSNKITVSSIDPVSPADTKTVRIAVKVNGMPNFRSMRFKVDGEIQYEYAGPEYIFSWNTDGFSSGVHNLVFEAADQTDSSWSRSEVRSISYTLLGNSASLNLKPEAPILVSPYDWNVIYSGNTATLCAQSQGDPDGDTISSYNFEIHDSGQNWSSGWTSSDCVTTSSLPAYTYQWHVQVKDSRGAISDWSKDFHFTIVNQNLSITSFTLTPLDSNSERVRLSACVSGQGEVGITIRFLLNSATDGTDKGSWTNIGELGVPCFSDSDAPVWNTLEDNVISGNGQHLIRVEAHGASTGWNGAVFQDQIITLPNRRPSDSRLQAPIPSSTNYREAIFINSRTINFKWDLSDRATSYRLSISDIPSPKDDATPIYRDTFPAGIDQASVTLSSDYSTLYWQIEAINGVGTNASTDQLFGIDRLTPECSIQNLAQISNENVFQVHWIGVDNLSGIASFNIQYQESRSDHWDDWMMNVPADKGYDLFFGQAGHSYSFRCLAIDKAGNIGEYSDSGGAFIKVDPDARPQVTWWDSGYAFKRNITIQNNMRDMVLPAGYPIKVMFTSGTIPTAAQLYDASLSPNKCDDLRIVFNNSTQINRVVRQCTQDVIEIWFRTQESVDSGTVSLSHELYYGNPDASSPPADVNQVWYPFHDADTQALYTFQETTGSTAYDSSGYGRNCSIDPSVSRINGKFSGAVDFNHANNGNASGLVCGSMSLSAFTVEFWYRPDAIWGDAIVAQMQSGVGNSWSLWNDGGRLRMEIWHCSSCASHQVRSNANLNNPSYVGKWNHIMVVYGGGNSVKFYINGVFDSEQFMDQGGIYSLNIPLQIGAINSSGQTAADIGMLKISSGVKDVPSYASFAEITNEPTTMVGDSIIPTIPGNADLVPLSINAYLEPTGEILVEATVQNQGVKSTINGFYTDLYVDHLPTGIGDYESLHFWVSDPIPAGGIVTLTTLIEDPAAIGLKSMYVSEERDWTLYAQADSSGAINEADKANNITAGTDICVAAGDDFENGDDTQSGAMVLSGTQTHNFDLPGDVDWLRFEAKRDQTYIISTSNLGTNADTYLYLFDQDGISLLASNDDYGNDLSSRIEWKAPQDRNYFILVNQWNPSSGGCGTSYVISLQEEGNSIYLPLIVK